MINKEVVEINSKFDLALDNKDVAVIEINYCTYPS